MTRFPVIRTLVPAMALQAMRDAVDAWWEAWCSLWWFAFTPEGRKQWRDMQRAEMLDADHIERGLGGGYAAGCGSDEA